MKTYSSSYRPYAMVENKRGAYVKLKDVVDLLEQLELYCPISNSSSSCPLCGGYPHMEGHSPDCTVGLILKSARRNQMKVEKKA